MDDLPVPPQPPAPPPAPPLASPERDSNRSRRHASLAILVAAVLQIAAPDLVGLHLRWGLAGLEVVLALAVWALHRQHVLRGRESESREKLIRSTSLALTGIVSAVNAVVAALLVAHGLRGAQVAAGDLLLAGACVWLTNVIVFSLWFWELDWGGPWARLRARQEPEPAPKVNENDCWVAFRFPQMEEETAAGSDPWTAQFTDYLYVSFTNAASFGPTDAMPLSRGAKWLMMFEAMISLATGLFLLARVVNVIG